MAQMAENQQQFLNHSVSPATPYVNMTQIPQFTSQTIGSPNAGTVNMNDYGCHSQTNNQQTNCPNMQVLHNTSTPVQNIGAKHRNGTNADLMELLNSKFDEVHKRLNKLETLEKKVSEFDTKLNQLWSDLDSRIARNTDHVTSLEQRVDVSEFDIEKAREEVGALKMENKTLQDSVCELQSKSMIKNLIIGGIKEGVQETPTETEECVRKFMKESLKMPDDEIESIAFDRVRRFGERKGNKPRSVITVCQDITDKDKVKPYRKKTRHT